jgi:hypothetical protein
MGSCLLLLNMSPATSKTCRAVDERQASNTQTHLCACTCIKPQTLHKNMTVAPHAHLMGGLQIPRLYRAKTAKHAGIDVLLQPLQDRASVRSVILLQA